MSEDLTYEKRGELLWVRFPEYETAEEVRPLVDSALRLVEEHGVTRVLIDTTASRIALSAIDYRRIGQYIARRPGAGELMIAVVRKPELVVEARQLEQWLVERDFRYRTFSSVTEAEEWLRDATR